VSPSWHPARFGAHEEDSQVFTLVVTVFIVATCSFTPEDGYVLSGVLLSHGQLTTVMYSCVTLVTRLWIRRPSLVPDRAGFFNVQTDSGAHLAPPIQLVSGFLLGVRRSERKVNRLSPSNVEVNPWGYSATPQCLCLAWCLVKYHGQVYRFIYTFSQC
jgi:hypothetical protein